jgi:hypothetical protein
MPLGLDAHGQHATVELAVNCELAVRRAGSLRSFWQCWGLRQRGRQCLYLRINPGRECLLPFAIHRLVCLLVLWRCRCGLQGKCFRKLACIYSGEGMQHTVALAVCLRSFPSSRHVLTHQPFSGSSDLAAT